MAALLGISCLENFGETDLFGLFMCQKLIEWEETQPLSLISGRKVEQRRSETGSPLRQDAYPDGSS